MTSFEARLLWIALSWMACLAAGLGLVGWPLLTGMFVGGLLLSDD